MNMIHQIRGYVLPGLLLITVVSGYATQLHPYLWRLWYVWALTVPLMLLGVYDLLQRRHSLLRNYPVLGHMRFLLEGAGPELHQYFVESNTSGRPFDRDYRALMYERAKNVEDKKAFGTELDVYADGYTWLNHSLSPKQRPEDPVAAFRVQVGEAHGSKSYSASILNISAMSFGALGANAILALNTAAKRGDFAHCTGEGGLSRYHREPGGDLIWQIGTGYFGCRTPGGQFDPEMFREQATLDQVKMIELKLSQGAKPGHGGILPAVKVTPEIAEARRVPVGEDCISPSGHSAFSTPVGLLEFVNRLRELSGGKPIGFKLCVGYPIEFFAICKAMLETRILPDFITVDGAEGGTGAAPVEFSNHIGFPLNEGLLLVQNGLVGCGLRDQLKIAASAKLMTGFRMAKAIAMGADWCNSARAFMFSIGCLQSQSCHTNTCPVGVATQDARLGRALNVKDKSARAYNFHRNTVGALAEVVGAAGLEHPSQLCPDHIFERRNTTEVHTLQRIYQFLEPGQLLDGGAPVYLQEYWERSSAQAFRPA